MGDKISWSFTAGAASGAGLSGSGAIDVDAATIASIPLEANMGAPLELSLQLADPAGVLSLAVHSTLYDGSVEVEGTTGAATALTGPLILFGAAVPLFANDLSTLKVQNTHADKAATLTILIGQDL